MEGETKSLEEHSSNVFSALASNPTQKNTNEDSSKEDELSNSNEQSNKEINNITDSDSSENKTDLESQNINLNRLDSNMMKESLNSFVDNLEASTGDVKKDDQTKTETKDISSNNPTEETNSNSTNDNPTDKTNQNSTNDNPTDETNSNLANDNIPDNSDSTKLSENNQSSLNQTDQISQRSYSSTTTSSYTNSGGKPNNQTPQLQGKLPQIVFHSPDSLTYKALTLQPLPPMNRQTRSSVVLDLSSYIDQCTQQGFIAEANFILEVSESVKKIQTPRKIEIQQMQLKDDLDNCNNEIEAQNS